jgi:enhancing lycopene biosynthesis protein 2
MARFDRVGDSLSSPAARGRWLARGAVLLAIAEGLVAVRNHLTSRLSERERKRLVEIVRSSKGRPSNLSDRERRELQGLISKVEPRELARTMAGSAVNARNRTRR